MGDPKQNAYYGFKMFDTLIVFLKDVFVKVYFLQYMKTTKKHAKLLSMHGQFSMLLLSSADFFFKLTFS